MRKLLLASTTLSLAAGSAALAADQRPAPQLRRAPVISTDSWAGVYIGGFAGGHRSTDRWVSDETDPPAHFLTGRPLDLKAGGFSGGFISGANMQHGNFVWGLETDIGLLTGKKELGQLRTLFPGVAEIDSIETKLRYDAHARLRFGWSMGGWLPFIATGVAYANTKTTLTNTQNGTRPDTQSVTSHRIGYTVGGGIDWMFAPNWIARVEYLHDRYLTEAFALPVITDSQYLELATNTVRGALIYKFGASTPAPGHFANQAAGASATTWAGVYVGAFAGGHWSTDRWTSDETGPPANPFVGGPYDIKVGGFTGGGLIGANVQYGNHVWSIEADAGVLTGNKEFGSLSTLFPGAFLDSIKTEMRWNAHARLRTGYSFGAWMPFVATGIAYANTRMTLADSTNVTRPVVASTSLDRIGYSVGGGIDWMFSPNWIARAEYLYDRFASASFANAVEADSQHMALHSHIVRGAMMYKFGNGSIVPAAPGVVKSSPASTTVAWNGGYIGAFVGGHWSTDRWSSDESGPTDRSGPFGLKTSGFAGGGLLGANLQYGNYVWGIEADAGALTGSKNFGPLRTLFPGNADADSIETQMRWNAHGRLRFGYAFGHWLPFIAAGLAYADTRVTSRDSVDAIPVSAIDLNRVGFTFGGGVDWRFSQSWTGRAEYLHDRYAAASYGTPTNFNSEHMELKSHIVRGALIYHYGSGGN